MKPRREPYNLLENIDSGIYDPPLALHYIFALTVSVLIAGMRLFLLQGQQLTSCKSPVADQKWTSELQVVILLMCNKQQSYPSDLSCMALDLLKFHIPDGGIQRKYTYIQGSVFQNSVNQHPHHRSMHKNYPYIFDKIELLFCFNFVQFHDVLHIIRLEL
jgi:hypothetical protein